ncbi:glycerol-3-phosphate dehydrogenase/oxidase [Foetidibacter luteolus]|uniref:glycerol-3-phosphate dehydrogenase/oxidase n=1 Tax=Foetidibacter luteolus TaxID=2608880 RepID=UPI00129A68BB|nr:glycerol-3-phosphate dehydrogenase/oxidase [Foetidibacter luteolus]
MNRQAALNRLHNEKDWDVIIIGGGATGLGAAVDAASRGYRTVLLEAHDFAKGTSSRATKLVHGGVRYLAQGNIKLVKEALRERGWLLKNAPHITSDLLFVIPVYSFFEKMFYGIGLGMYDLLSGKLSLGKTKWLSKKQTIQHLPDLKEKGLAGGIAYHDGQFDDARLAVELAKTAVEHGAVIVNYSSVTGLLKHGEKVNGVTVQDKLDGTTYQLNARAVINATGVFADHVMQMDEQQHSDIVTPSQGIHLVVDKKFFTSNHALMIPKTSDGRVLFAVPWHNKVVIGTTDNEVPEISLEPRPLQSEIEFVLQHANKYFKTNIERSDVKSMFAGLRPLVKQKNAENTAVIRRDHTIIVSKAHLITITGGKWTTYRKMAEEVVNQAVITGRLPKRTCITSNLPIGGTEALYPRQDNSLLHKDFEIQEKDIAFFVQHEMAATVEDVLARRTRLLFLDAGMAIAKAPAVAAIMARYMNKDEAWQREQVEAFNATAKGYIL